MFLLPTGRRVVENRKYSYHALYTNKTFRMCDTIYIGCTYKSDRKKNKNVNNFDVIHSNGGNRFIIHSRSLWKPFVRPSLR